MNILITLLCASQFIMLPKMSFRWIKEISVELLILTALCSLIWKKSKPMALLLGWSIFLFFLYKGFFVNDAVKNANFTLNPIALFNLMNIVLYGFFYYILHQIKLDTDKIYKTFCFIAIVQSVYVLLQFLQLDQFFLNISHLINNQKVSWPVGLWANEALVSWCIAICSPFFLRFKEPRFKVGYGVCFMACLATKCSAGIVAFILGFIFWLFFTKGRKYAIILLVCLSLFGAWALQSGKFTYYFNPTHRFEVWKKAIDIYKEKPITGRGLGSFRMEFYNLAPEFRSDGHWAQAHNDYIQVLYEHGLVGLGILLSLMWITFLSFWRKRVGLIPVTSLFVMAMLAFWGFPFRTSMGVLALVSLVLAEKEFNNA